MLNINLKLNHRLKNLMITDNIIDTESYKDTEEINCISFIACL